MFCQHCLMIEYLHGCLMWICKMAKNSYFIHTYLCFILLRGDLNICGWEIDGKLTGLRRSSMDVLSSKSSSRARD